MAKQALNGALLHLCKVAAVQIYRELSDRQLLERFISAHDDAAFTVLIERHGPMVLGVARRALPNRHDAEDACQAAFLVLARKAGSVRKQTSLVSWLHGVTCRVAARLKRDYARRRRRERSAEAIAPKDPAAEVSWREVQQGLDEEMQQLPERFRTPLILCYLECLTRDEAAQRLGLTLGALHGRLERARDLLRARLTQRGLTLSGVLSAAVLGGTAAQAALAPTFVVSSAKAALLVATGQPLSASVVPSQVVALTQEVVKTMFLAKLKLGAVAALCAGLVVALIGGSFTSPGIAQETQSEAALVKAAGAAYTAPQSESDSNFIRRISKDLRGAEPTPAEIHFFVANKDAGRRQKLIDLFIQERQTKQAATAKSITDRIDELVLERLARAKATDEEFLRRALLDLTGGLPTPADVWDFRKSTDPDKRAKFIDRLVTNPDTQFARAWRDIMATYQTMPTGLAALQKQFYQDLHAAKEKADIAKVTQSYLDRLIVFVKSNPKSSEVPAAIRQIVLVLESRSMSLEATEWRIRLLEERRRQTPEPVPPNSNDRPSSPKEKSPEPGAAAAKDGSELAITLPFAVPTKEEVLRALPEKTRSKDARMQCELLECRLDAARQYPGVGSARLAHAHFKCTVTFENGDVQTVYIDRDHLLPQQ